MTPAWVLRKACSAVVPGARISRSSSVTNRPWSVRAVESTEPSAVEYITSVLLGVTAGARPAEERRKRPSKGMGGGGASRTDFPVAPRLFILLGDGCGLDTSV